jgi:tetratricopeptide (TPR) repeat protein
MTLITFSLLISMAAPEEVHRQAVLYMEHGQYAEAAALCREALPQFPAGSLEAGLMLRDLANAYYAEGFLKKAEATQLRLLKLVQVKLGEEDGNAALAWNRLGEIYFAQGRITNARGAFEEALRIGESALDKNSPHLATILHDLGVTRLVEKRYGLAQELLERALAIRDSADPAHAALTRANLTVLVQASRAASETVARSAGDRAPARP